MFACRAIFFSLLSTLLFTSTATAGKQSTIKLKANVFNDRGAISKALAFVYLEDSLVQHAYSNRRGQFTFHLERERNYKITISKPGYVASSIDFDTHNMRKDEVKKVNFPIRMRRVRSTEDYKELITFTVKWNYIIERFESFNYNMGWKMELEQVNDKQKARKEEEE